MGVELCTPTLSSPPPHQGEKEKPLATDSGFRRSLNINYQLKGVRHFIWPAHSPWPWQLAPEKGSLAELEDKERTPFIGRLYRRVRVLLISQFQNSRDSYFIAQGLFPFSSSLAVCPLFPYLLSESQP